MKYVNRNSILLLCACLFVTACATGPGQSKSKAAAGKPVEINLVSTEEFIPAPKKDSAGVAIPYEAMPNPYALQKGKIKKESVASFIEAKRSLKLKQYAQAEATLMAITTDDKALSGPWVVLGDIANEQKNYDKAITSYQKAISLNDKNVNAYMHLALAQRQHGDFLKAQNTYAKILSIWRDCPEAHLNLAVLYDLYLNHPLRAQKHMEAYQFLTSGQNQEVAQWLIEIQQRTGVAPTLNIEAPKAESKSLSYR